MAGRGSREAPGLPTPLAERVLDLVARIPSGRVMTYGGVALALGEGGARQVGTVMARYGSGVPWHRVVRADGRPAAGHEREALRRLRAEGVPLRDDRVDLAVARWRPEAGDVPARAPDPAVDGGPAGLSERRAVMRG